MHRCRTAPCCLPVHTWYIAAEWFPRYRPIPRGRTWYWCRSHTRREEDSCRPNWFECNSVATVAHRYSARRPDVPRRNRSVPSKYSTETRTEEEARRRRRYRLSPSEVPHPCRSMPRASWSPSGHRTRHSRHRDEYRTTHCHYSPVPHQSDCLRLNTSRLPVRFLTIPCQSTSRTQDFRLPAP